MIILARKVERSERIPIQSRRILLREQLRVLVQHALIRRAHHFVFAHFAVFFFPVAPRIEDPVIDPGVTQLEGLREIVESIRSIGGTRHRCNEMETARWIRSGKRRGVGRSVGVEKSRGAVFVFVSITESGQHGQFLRRHPEQVEIGHVFVHLRRAAQIQDAVVVRLQR